MKNFYDDAWRLFRIAVVLIFLWLLVCMFTACRSTDHVVRTDKIVSSDSISLINVSAGSSLFASQLSQMDGSWSITYYDTSQPADPVTGRSPVVAEASGSFSRRDSIQVNHQDSTHTDQTVLVHQDQTEHVVDSLVTKPVTSDGSTIKRITSLFISLSILIFVIIIGYLVFRIIK